MKKIFANTVMALGTMLSFNANAQDTTNPEKSLKNIVDLFQKHVQKTGDIAPFSQNTVDSTNTITTLLIMGGQVKTHNNETVEYLAFINSQTGTEKIIGGELHYYKPTADDDIIETNYMFEKNDTCYLVYTGPAEKDFVGKPIDHNMCKDKKIGEFKTIEAVVEKLGTLTVQKPDTEPKKIVSYLSGEIIASSNQTIPQF